MTITTSPATRDRWQDLLTLFGNNGAYDGCWCIWPRVTSREYAEGRGAGNRQRLCELVEAGREPGLLAYDGDQPVGWVSAGPGAALNVLDTQRWRREQAAALRPAVAFVNV